MVPTAKLAGSERGPGWGYAPSGFFQWKLDLLHTHKFCAFLLHAAPWRAGPEPHRREPGSALLHVSQLTSHVYCVSIIYVIYILLMYIIHMYISTIIS